MSEMEKETKQLREQLAAMREERDKYQTDAQAFVGKLEKQRSRLREQLAAMTEQRDRAVELLRPVVEATERCECDFSDRYYADYVASSDYLTTLDTPKLGLSTDTQLIVPEPDEESWVDKFMREHPEEFAEAEAELNAELNEPEPNK